MVVLAIIFCSVEFSLNCITSSVMNFDTAIKEGEIRMQALEQKHICHYHWSNSI